MDNTTTPTPEVVYVEAKRNGLATVSLVSASHC